MTSLNDIDTERASKMMNQINDEMKELKLKAKRLFREMEEAEGELANVQKEAKSIRRKAQMKQLKGNELVKLDHLLRMGYDSETIQDHLEKSVTQLRKEATKIEKDVANTEKNIDKLITSNKEAEKACSGAQNATTTIMVNTKKYQALLDNAEVELYAEESRVKHFQTVRGVEITKDNNAKKAIKDIIKLFQTKSDDVELRKKIRKVAEKADIDLSDLYSPISSPKKKATAGRGGGNSSSLSFVETLNLSDSDDSSDIEISSASSTDDD